MKKSDRIKTLVELKAEQEKNALKGLGIYQRKLTELENQVESLKSYRNEYQESFNQLGRDGIKISQVLEFKSFIDKLDQAIEGQEHAMCLCKEELMQKRKMWESIHHKTNGLQKVLDSTIAVETQLKSRKEQSEMDERASRLGRNSKDGI
ncbi:MAG: flagellar export protein FliJ [Methylococcaceae bacterium]|nr:flagellar export protein FliJ [Methylococcaceae bacterium]